MAIYTFLPSIPITLLITVMATWMPVYYKVVISAKSIYLHTDTFATEVSAIPALLKKEYNEKIQDCIKDDLKNSALLYLYAFYGGLLKGLEDTEFCYRFRHVRNLINNSRDHIREVSMTGLMANIEHVVQGKITKAKALQINRFVM